MKSCLLIIDVQTALFAESPTPADADVVIERINALAGRARARGLKVIVVHHEEPSSELEYNSAGWQTDPRLHVQPGDLHVRKTTVDSFLETTLESILRDAAIDHLTICGYATEFCIDTTVRRAASLGYEVTLASDAHTTQDKPDLSAELIRRHHNRTLANAAFKSPIKVCPSDQLWN
ncbi:MAG: cysteine hydrolase family protein [Opitutus sp.]